MLRILLSLALMIVTIDGQLVMEPNLNQLTKKVGDEVAIYCTNQGTTGQPEWTGPDGQVIGTINGGGSSHLFVEENTFDRETKLQIVDLEREDEGTYTCRLSGSTGQSIQIFVFEDITFTKQDEEQLQAFEEFESASIKCTVRASPSPSIEWYQGGVRIYPGGRYYIDPNVGLTISNITRDDEATYTCRAVIRSLSESKSMDIFVDVQVPPTWLFEPSDETRAVGSSVEFHCRADGDPPPDYTWKFKNNIINYDGVKYTSRNDGEYFTINNLQKSDDGSYVCEASNAADTISGAGELTVLDPPRGNEQQNETVTEGQTVRLYCTVVQGEDCKLKWFHDGREMVLGQQPTNSRIIIQESIVDTQLTLTITGVQRSDGGGYTCELENEVGISNVTHYVLVEYEPTINTTITRDQVFTWVGNPVNVTCHWEGYPTPKVIWKRGGWRLNSTDAVFYNFGNGSSSAEVTPTELDFGSYVCEASNRIDTNTHTIDLVQAFVPSEPLGVTRGEVTSTTLEILFEVPLDDGNLPITGYRVEYWVQYEETNTMMDFFNETEEIKLINLSPSQTYYFRMAAENDVGFGKWSENATAKTITYRPPRAPTIISPDVSSSPFQYELAWRAPEDNGGSPITRYVIRHALVLDPTVEEIPSYYEEQPVNSEARSHILYDLEKDKYYYIELFAVSGLGDGEPAEKIIKTAQGTLDPTVPPTSLLGVVRNVDTKIVVAVIVAAFILILILVDVCCYLVNDCGLLMCLCVQCCGKHTGTHEVDVELAADYSGFKNGAEIPAWSLDKIGGAVTTNGSDVTEKATEPTESESLMDGRTI
ncbi:Neural cell adhesion molecule 1 [Holothuria leucospilota]|uniref:Neural cell adhesion molecule 1 n=1 Tax=Holothuria leucospilota TaxID=206669 RepID=A0A9Q1BYS2_HOLLE|nr:Neural cell adhesion molecule 1 [Holothuria leucospilota]